VSLIIALAAKETAGSPRPDQDRERTTVQTFTPSGTFLYSRGTQCCQELCAKKCRLGPTVYINCGETSTELATALKAFTRASRTVRVPFYPPSSSDRRVSQLLAHSIFQPRIMHVYLEHLMCIRPDEVARADQPSLCFGHLDWPSLIAMHDCGFQCHVPVKHNTCLAPLRSKRACEDRGSRPFTCFHTPNFLSQTSSPSMLEIRTGSKVLPA